MYHFIIHKILAAPLISSAIHGVRARTSLAGKNSTIPSNQLAAKSTIGLYDFMHNNYTQIALNGFYARKIEKKFTRAQLSAFFLHVGFYVCQYCETLFTQPL